MKSIFALLLAVILSTGCTDTSKQENVKKPQKPHIFSPWQSGKFYYKDPIMGTMLVNRTETYQEEFVKRNGMVVKFDIEWHTDTTYTLTYDTIIENPNNGSLPQEMVQLGLIKKCTIVKQAPGKYKEKAYSNLNDRANYTTMYLSQ